MEGSPVAAVGQYRQQVTMIFENFVQSKNVLRFKRKGPPLSSFHRGNGFLELHLLWLLYKGPSTSFHGLGFRVCMTIVCYQLHTDNCSSTGLNVYKASAVLSFRLRSDCQGRMTISQLVT